MEKLEKAVKKVHGKVEKSFLKIMNIFLYEMTGGVDAEVFKFCDFWKNLIHNSFLLKIGKKVGKKVA